MKTYIIEAHFHKGALRNECMYLFSVGYLPMPSASILYRIRRQMDDGLERILTGAAVA
jgi:hypothetical protein